MAHGEYPGFNPEIDQNNIEEELKAKFENNVVKFPEKQPFKYDDLQGKSMQILEDLGYHSTEEAKTSLDDMKAQKETAVLSFTQKIKDKIFNQGNETSKFMELESKIARLSKALKMAKNAQGTEHQDYEEPAEFKEAA